MKAALDSSVSGLANTFKTMQNPQAGSSQEISSSRSWSDIAQRMSQLMSAPSKSSLQVSQQVGNLTELFKLQMDVSRYQLKIELVSKVSESAVASMRKLQQNQ